MIHIKRQILVVGKDKDVCQAICDRLVDNVTDACCMTSAIEALANYIQNEYCLVILDVQPMDTNCMELLRTMRNTKYTPILVLTVMVRFTFFVSISKKI